jgi:hypothetical protein
MIYMIRKIRGERNGIIGRTNKMDGKEIARMARKR